MTKGEYQRYLATPHWHAVRNRKLEAAGYRCEFAPIAFDHPKHGPIRDQNKRCPVTSDLEVHHRHYATLGSERDHDLEVLCRFHHLVRHASTVAEADCETCGDGPRSVDEDDVIVAVEDAVRAAKGNIGLVDIEDIEDVGHCSYCER